VASTPVDVIFVRREALALRLDAVAELLPNLQHLRYDQGVRGRDGSEDFHVSDELFARAAGFRQLKGLMLRQTDLRRSWPSIMRLGD
jgi:hypothetical protein